MPHYCKADVKRPETVTHNATTIAILDHVISIALQHCYDKAVLILRRFLSLQAGLRLRMAASAKHIARTSDGHIASWHTAEASHDRSNASTCRYGIVP